MDNRAKQGGRAGASACVSSSRPLSMAPPKKHPNPLLFVGISALCDGEKPHRKAKT